MQVPPSAPRILIVEPHKGALAMMTRRLVDSGYRVIACSTASHAVSELHRSPIQLLLSELGMDPMNGIELTRLVRDDSQLRDLPIILINGRSDRYGACDALAAGADDIVAKPFDFDVVIAKIGRAIVRARGMTELRQDNATLDARIVARAIELGEVRAAFAESEAERSRLSAMMQPSDRY